MKKSNIELILIIYCTFSTMLSITLGIGTIQTKNRISEIEKEIETIEYVENQMWSNQSRINNAILGINYNETY